MLNRERQLNALNEPMLNLLRPYVEVRGQMFIMRLPNNCVYLGFYSFGFGQSIGWYW